MHGGSVGLKLVGVNTCGLRLRLRRAVGVQLVGVEGVLGPVMSLTGGVGGDSGLSAKDVGVCAGEARASLSSQAMAAGVWGIGLKETSRGSGLASGCLKWYARHFGRAEQILS